MIVGGRVIYDCPARERVKKIKEIKIGSFNLPCKSHYFIKQGKVIWL